MHVSRGCSLRIRLLDVWERVSEEQRHTEVTLVENPCVNSDRLSSVIQMKERHVDAECRFRHLSMKRWEDHCLELCLNSFDSRWKCSDWLVKEERWMRMDYWEENSWDVLDWIVEMNSSFVKTTVANEKRVYRSLSLGVGMLIRRQRFLHLICR